MGISQKRFARVIIVNQFGEVMAICQSGKNGNHYCFPGGKVERFEKPKMAARRELYEELGIKLPNNRLKHCLTNDFTFYGELWRGHYYICTYSGLKPTLLEYPKITSAEFYDIKDLEKLPSDSKSFIEVVKSTQIEISAIRVQLEKELSFA